MTNFKDLAQEIVKKKLGKSAFIEEPFFGFYGLKAGVVDTTGKAHTNSMYGDSSVISLKNVELLSNVILNEVVGVEFI